MTELEKLKKKERFLRYLLQNNINAQKKIIADNFCKEKGIYVGDVVTWEYREKQLKGKITRIDTYGGPYFIVLIYNANGKPGKRETKIYSWDLKTLKKAEE